MFSEYLFQKGLILFFASISAVAEDERPPFSIVIPHVAWQAVAAALPKSISDVGVGSCNKGLLHRATELRDDMLP